jgi:hypothetical protein
LRKLEFDSILNCAFTYFATSENERVAVLLIFVTAAIPNLRKNCLVAGMLYTNNVKKL